MKLYYFPKFDGSCYKVKVYVNINYHQSNEKSIPPLHRLNIRSHMNIPFFVKIKYPIYSTVYNKIIDLQLGLHQHCYVFIEMQNIKIKITHQHIFTPHKKFMLTKQYFDIKNLNFKYKRDVKEKVNEIENTW